jgi:hypothetical protein
MTGTQSRLRDGGARVCWHDATTETESGSAVFFRFHVRYGSDNTQLVVSSVLRIPVYPGLVIQNGI